MGEWIETLYSCLIFCFMNVAPYMGAWIETLKQRVASSVALSHPTWVRGLKPEAGKMIAPYCVAPYMGAWIETAICS